MPILKKEESLPQRPVVIVLYGEPGIGKTSLFNTANNPLLLDFDRGVDRSINRQDTLLVRKWEDVQEEEKAGTFKDYQTIGIDTAKAALDDFLMTYVVKQDYKNAKNKLAAYGAIGDEFKIFVSNRRSENADLVIIAHSKDEKEGDMIKKIPDVTGGSYNLLLRIADQVGYMKTVNNKRTIQFEPSDGTIGKNVARIPIIEIPNETEPAFKTFMADLINNVKSAINAMSEAQKEAIDKMEKFKQEIEECQDPDTMNSIFSIIVDMPNPYQAALRKLIKLRADKLGFIADPATKSFIKPVPEPAKNTPAPTPADLSVSDQKSGGMAFPTSDIKLPSEQRQQKRA
jgi:ATP-dependent Lon protease